MSVKQAIEALEELVEYAETAGFDWSLDNARAALAALRSMPQGEPERLALTQATAPRKIWLNLFGDADTGCEPFPDDHEGVTWSDDEPGDFNVPYVRADLATQPTEAVRMSEAEERAAFELELRKQCFQKPTPEAHDLAWSMWKAKGAAHE